MAEKDKNFSGCRNKIYFLVFVVDTLILIIKKFSYLLLIIKEFINGLSK